MFIKRHVFDFLQKSKKSILLLGPRQTGKSTLIKNLSPDLTLNLAHEATFLDFVRNPSELEERLSAQKRKTVFIDEIQRLPRLLNTIQHIIDEKRSGIKFYLTGSSARKLKRGEANLLPGRIHSYHLGPLTSSELRHNFDLKKALSTGTLPGIWTEADEREKKKTLETYASTYLIEEIQAEALSRNLEGFSRFLFLMAAESGKFLDISKLAAQARISRQSATRYFEILEDTLIVRRCDSFAKSQRRRLVQSPRFFFFDTGVLNGLLGNFIVSPDRIGVLFEHFIFNQIFHGAAAKDERVRLASYRTEHGAEVDFIVEWKGETWAIEVKASTNIGRSDLRGLKSFGDYFKRNHRKVIVYIGNVSKKIENILILPWQKFLKDLGV